MVKKREPKSQIERTVTIFDVAAMAGTSTSTVSNVMKDEGHFSEKTRATVLAAVEALHYVPNIAAQGLSSRRSNLIGIYGINLKYLCDWPNMIMWGALNKLNGTRYSLYVVNNTFPFKLSSDEILLKQARAKFLCGIILVGWNIRAEDVALFREMEIPVVLIEQRNPTVHSIEVDHFKSGYLGTQHLVKRGCKRIALVRLGDSGPSVNDRQKGYKAALKEGGLSFDENLVLRIPYSAEGATYEPGYQLGLKLGKSKSRPDGIFCTASSDASVGLMNGLRAAGLRVPQDMPVVGWDDMETARHSIPLMTVLRQPFEEMGQIAAECVLESQKREKGEIRRVVLEPKLIIRESA